MGPNGTLHKAVTLRGLIGIDPLEAWHPSHLLSRGDCWEQPFQPQAHFYVSIRCSIPPTLKTNKRKEGKQASKNLQQQKLGRAQLAVH